MLLAYKLHLTKGILLVLLQGPTLTLRIKSYSLMSDVAASQQRPRMPPNAFKTAPLVVLNNFSPAKKELALAANLFQGMFPSINVHTVNLATCQVMDALVCTAVLAAVVQQPYSYGMLVAPSRCWLKCCGRGQVLIQYFSACLFHGSTSCITVIKQQSHSACCSKLNHLSALACTLAAALGQYASVRYFPELTLVHFMAVSCNPSAAHRTVFV